MNMHNNFFIDELTEPAAQTFHKRFLLCKSTNMEWKIDRPTVSGIFFSCFNYTQVLNLSVNNEDDMVDLLATYVTPTEPDNSNLSAVNVESTGEPDVQNIHSHRHDVSIMRFHAIEFTKAYKRALNIFRMAASTDWKMRNFAWFSYKNEGVVLILTIAIDNEDAMEITIF